MRGSVHLLFDDFLKFLFFLKTPPSNITMTMSSLDLSSSILIVGAGTWGCSTALHLARRGYKNVTVLDPHPVPSPIAAGNDVNKIMEHKELKGKMSKYGVIRFEY